MDLSKIAKKLGLENEGVRMKWEEYLKYGKPSIAWINTNHFVVFDGSLGEKIVLIDMNNLPNLYSKNELKDFWKGELLIFSNNDDKQSPYKSPRLVFEKTDIGSIVNDDTLTTFIYSLYNLGEENLLISRMKSDCDCTAPEITSKNINFNRKSEIKVFYNSTGKQGYNKTLIQLTTNDPLFRECSLILQTNVIPILYLSSPQIDFGTTNINENRTQPLLIGAKDINCIKSIETSSPYIDVESISLNSDPELFDNYNYLLYRIHLYCNQPGLLNEAIYITTNLDDKPFIEIPIYANINQNLKIIPQAFFGGRIKKNELQSKKIHIASKNNQKFKIKNIRAENKNIKFNIMKEEYSDNNTIQLNYVSFNDTGIVKDVIVVDIISNMNHEIKIPFIAYVE